MSDFLFFGAAAAALWFAAERRLEVALAGTVLFTPISHAHFFPQSVFGIPGMNPVNVLWLAAALLLLRESSVDSLRRALTSYLSLPFALFIAVYLVGVARTALALDTLVPLPPMERPGLGKFLLEYVFKALHILATGALVALYRVQRGTFWPLGHALAVLPVMLAVLAAYYTWSAPPTEPGVAVWIAARDHISEQFATHTNSLGRAAVVLLLIGIARPWPLPRALHVAALVSAVALVLMSYSRTSVGAALMIVPFACWRYASWADRGWIAGAAVCVALLLAPSLSERARTGLDAASVPASAAVMAERPGAAENEAEATGRKSTGEEVLGDATDFVHRVMVGRTGRIWPLLWPRFEAAPVFGSGILAVWKPLPGGTSLEYDHPHNAFIEVGIDLGLVGLALLLWWLWSLVGAAQSFPPLFPILALWLLTSVTGSSYYPQFFNFLNWIVLGLATGAAAAAAGAANSPVGDGREAGGR